MCVCVCVLVLGRTSCLDGYIYINDKYMQFQVSLQKLRRGCVKATEDISLC